jgi:hypothetical protein
MLKMAEFSFPTAEFSHLIGRIPTPVDEVFVNGMVNIFDAFMRTQDAMLDIEGDCRELHYERAVEALRPLAVSDDDHQQLNEYLAGKLQTIARWRSNCRRCHKYVRRNLIAELRGEDPGPNPYSEYWKNSSALLLKLLR